MAFELYGEAGYLGRLASIEGYGDLVELSERGNLKLFQGFAFTGYTAKPQALKVELEDFIRNTPKIDRELKDTLENLIRLLGKTKEVAIVHG